MKSDRVWDKFGIESFKHIHIPFIRYDSYIIDTDNNGIAYIKGIGAKKIQFSTDKKMFLRLYTFGRGVDEILHVEGISTCSDSAYNRFAMEWVEQNGFPVMPEAKELDSEACYFLPVKFYLNVLVYRAILESAYMIYIPKHDEVRRGRILSTIDTPTTNWGKHNIGERLETLMRLGGGIYPFIEYREERNYSVTIRATSHLSAACAQIAVSLIDNNIFTRTCLECGNTFVALGKEKTCSYFCRLARKNKQCKASKAKPMELRDPRKRRTRKAAD